MGQKVHPYGFRVGYNKDWHSHWFAKKEFAEYLAEDMKLKRDLKKRFAGAGVSFFLVNVVPFLNLGLAGFVLASIAAREPSTQPMSTRS